LSLLCAAALLLLLPCGAEAQLEVLLRGVEPTEPRPGACGLYRFEAREPNGERSVEFRACIEEGPEAEIVLLPLWSGDSLEARVALAAEMFSGGGSLLEHVRSVVQIEKGRSQRLGPEDWQELPALSPAPQLPVVADSSLGVQRHPGTGLECHGRFLEEARSSTRQMGEVEVTQAEERRLQIWTAPEAPILGVVSARAVVRSERRFSQPIPGVPQRGPRVSHYALELLEYTQNGPPDHGSSPHD
jgi:hypothetical protein